jgi:tetratricopeptide (TPR) repeat protein
LRNLKRHDEALQLYHQVLSKLKATLQAPHQSLIDTQFDLVETFNHLQNFTEALPLAREALQQQETLSGPTHPKCLRLRLMLASLAYKLSDWHLAEALFSKTLAQMESWSEESRKEILDPLTLSHALHARTLSELGRADEGEQRARKALKLDCSEGYEKCREVDGFVDRFGGLMLAENISSCKQSAAVEKPSAQVEQHPCMNNQALQPLVTQQGSLPAENKSQISGQEENCQSLGCGERQTASSVTAASKKQPPPPKRKPVHLQLKQ